MARPVDPNAQFRVKPHTTKGYTYASTQPSYLDPVSGKKKYRYHHWGTVDESLKFTPGSSFYLASPEERARLIFPENWQLGEAFNSTCPKDSERPISCDYGCQNRLYGDIWLLEQVASKTGIRQDLEAVFDGNNEIVDDILTLAMFPYLTKYTYNRVARWQKYVKSPSSMELTPAVITKLTQSITECHRMELLKLRAARLGNNEFCAVDSTNRSAYGDSLVDIRWGKNKENLPLAQTTEVVVYALSNHMPVYYRTFPGNMPDCRTIDVILADLENAGFNNIILITDRGYESIHNLETIILRGQPMVMCAKTNQKRVMEIIKKIADFQFLPEEMKADNTTKLAYNQYDIDYEFKTKENNIAKSEKLKLNLFLDPNRRCDELVELVFALEAQKNALNELLESKSVIPDMDIIKKEYCYYKVFSDPDTKIIQSFERNESLLQKARTLSGFFSIITHGLDFDPIEIYHIYRLRDEQEKYFQMMKDQMVSDRQRNWSEEGKTGRLLILFVSLILGSYVRHVWKSTNLHDLFSSSLDIIDEMKSIRCIERANQPKMITPFIGAQISICKAFGFKVPAGCAPAYIPRQQPKRKRGRPPKKKGHRVL